MTEAHVKTGRGLASTEHQNWRGVYWLTTVNQAKTGLTAGTEQERERAWDHPESGSLPVPEHLLEHGNS